MAKLKFVLAIGLVFVLCPVVSALELQEGMHGMPWNSLVSDFPRLKEVRDAGPVAYYVASDTLYHVGDQLVPSVVYGFYRHRFFAAYIKLGLPVQFSNLERHFRAKYGAPKEERGGTGRLTVLRWEVGDVNIKIKMKPPGSDIKMAVYYRPLAGDLTREQAEDIPEDIYPESSPGEGAPVEPLVP